MTGGCLLVAFAPDEATGNDDCTIHLFAQYKSINVINIRITNNTYMFPYKKHVKDIYLK